VAVFEAVVDAPEHAATLRGMVAVSGWSLSDAGRTTAVSIRADTTPLGSLFVGLPRPDVGSLFPHAWAPASGYAGVVDVGACSPGPAVLILTLTDATGAIRELGREVTIAADHRPPPSPSAFETLLIDWLNRPAWDGQHGPLVTRGAYQLQRTAGVDHLRRLLDQWRTRGDDAVPAALIEGIWRAGASSDATALPNGWRGSTWGRQLLCWLNDDAGPARAAEPLVSWFSLIVHASDPELRREFPDPLGTDRQRWSAWMATSANQRFDDVADLVVPIAASLSDDKRARTTTSLRRLLQRQNPTPLDFRALMDTPSPVDDAVHHGALRRSWPKRYTIRGVNIIGHYTDNSGLAESTRATARSVRAAGWPLSTLDVGPADPAITDTEWASPAIGSPYAVSILHDNVAAATDLFRRLGARFMLDRTTVAYWYWELSDVPAQHRGRFAQVDEVWVASRFTADAFQPHSEVPVVVVPPSVDVDLQRLVPRRRFGLPEDHFLFLAMASVHSAVARKNPYGAVEAFARAFEGAERPDVALVLKINGLELVPSLAAQLAEAAERMPLYVITESLSRQDTLGLISCCDALVSLHRAEGFGLPIAEAMALGRPVVATAYSGNMDFTDADTAFLVDHDIVPLIEDHGPYPAGMVWAEPRLDAAAAQLRLVHGDQALAARRAAAAQRRIRERYGVESTARAVDARLTELMGRAATLARR
jgi:glycosyltransferase involved in cell wall biosynthesis